MGKKSFSIYCAFIMLILVVPFAGTAIQAVFGDSILKESELSGVSAVPEKPQISWNAVLSGEYQEEAEEYFTYHLFSRRSQTRLYNQLLYSLFNSTDNQDMLVGRENYIYEKPYADAYLWEMPAWQETELRENIQKMVLLADRLAERGIPLVVRMSPSKAEVYPEYLPSSYDRFVDMKQSGEYGSSWYDVFVDEIKKTNLPYYDAHELLNVMKAAGEVVFTKGGTHWSLAPMKEYVNGLNALMEPLLQNNLGRMVEESKTVKFGDMGISSDSDIWQICWNCFSAPPQYPSPHIAYGVITPPPPPRGVFESLR